MRRAVTLLGFLLLLAAGCDNSGDNGLHFEKKGRRVPAFSADSTYYFVQKQVDFGPRNPGSAGHRQALDYLQRKLRAYAGSSNVFVQRFDHVGYDSDTLELANVIAAFNPSNPDRIMLSAHWDTRPRAEQADSARDKPILGADDGGSGVAVLLELARLFRDHKPPVGVDLVFFDGEDYGREGDQARYFLGSRYWAQNPPVPGYHPRFGILLDMVGGKDAVFPKEVMSMRYAPNLVDEIWSIAGQMGYRSLFPDREGAGISDDHLVINDILQIPTIDIIHHRAGEEGRAVFPPYWHTHRDNMDIITRHTLQATGDVLAELVYNRL